MKDNDEWRKVNAYTISLKSWRITKSFVDGATMYALWKVGEIEPRGYFECADDAKEAAK